MRWSDGNALDEAMSAAVSVLREAKATPDDNDEIIAKAAEQADADLRVAKREISDHSAGFDLNCQRCLSGPPQRV